VSVGRVGCFLFYLLRMMSSVTCGVLGVVGDVHYSLVRSNTALSEAP